MKEEYLSKEDFYTILYEVARQFPIERFHIFNEELDIYISSYYVDSHSIDELKNILDKKGYILTWELDKGDFALSIRKKENTAPNKLEVTFSKIKDGVYCIYGELDTSYDIVEAELDGKDLYITFWKDKGKNWELFRQYKVRLEDIKEGDYTVTADNLGRGIFVIHIIDRNMERELLDKGINYTAELIKENE